MSIEMIDPVAAERALAAINVGDKITAKSVAIPSEVVAKTAYGLTLKGTFLDFTIPVNKLFEYEKELDAMGRSPLPAGTAPRGRGRPPGSGGSQAPVEPPPARQPPTPATTAAVAEAESGWMRPAQQPQPTFDLPSVKTVTIEEAEGNSNWVADSINKAIDELRQQFDIIIESVSRTASEQQIPLIRSCGQCIHFDETQCGKWNMVPPMPVIVKAEKMCPDFLAGDSEEEPPF